MVIDLSNVPNNPGCYIFKNNKNVVIYVGKAKNLKNRISIYFSNSSKDKKTQVLVLNIDSLDFIVTNTEIEALILENNLIKKYSPKFNIDLKDSKRYAYLRLTDEKFPRLVLERKRDNAGEYFGPFTSALMRQYVHETVIKTFKLRTCKKFPKKECLRFHLNICSAPCTNQINLDDYNNNINQARLVLKGNIKEMIFNLNLEMSNFSKNHDFENALILRDKINSLKYLKEKQTVQREKKYNEDIINYIIIENKIYLMVFNVYKGILENKQEFEFDYTSLDSNSNFLEEFILRYYSENIIPKEIIIPIEIDETINHYLETLKNEKVIITVPKIGDKKILLDLVEKNIKLQYSNEIETLTELKDKLKLDKLPNVIECFDISHLAGTNVVASMVQFVNGKPKKENYRRFKIKHGLGNDDFKSMQEVVRRRYYKLLSNNESLPDLIIIDGGKGQLNVALDVLNSLGIFIPIISLAKKEEEVFFPGESFSLKLDKKSRSLRMLQNIRDEAHRFAITYNKLLRSKEIQSQK
jgi:excinuclease ABC subunit C